MKTFEQIREEQQPLEEAIILLPYILAGARIISFGLTRLGVNVAKLALPFPFGGISGAIAGTAIGAIAMKYDLTAIIKTQEFGTNLIMDLASRGGKKITAELAAGIFEKAMISGIVTLGAILMVMIVPKSREKALKFFKGKGKKKTLSKSDIKSIGKKIRKSK